jgi:hypothetical protein
MKSTEQEMLPNANRIEISGRLSVILIKQLRRICKGRKGLIFIGDLLIHRNYPSFNLNAVNRQIECCDILISLQHSQQRLLYRYHIALVSGQVNPIFDRY